MQESNTDTIKINDGVIFDGTRDQFADCFFTNANNEEILSWCEENNFSFSVNDNWLRDIDVFIPIFERKHFSPLKTSLKGCRKGEGSLPYFLTIEECGDWCKDNNSELKKQKINNSAEDETSLEYKLLMFQMKLYNVKLTASQRSCVLGAMQELTLQRKLGNWSNKMI